MAPLQGNSEESKVLEYSPQRVDDRDFEEETMRRQEDAYKKLLASIPPIRDTPIQQQLQVIKEKPTSNNNLTLNNKSVASGSQVTASQIRASRKSNLRYSHQPAPLLKVQHSVE